MMTLRIESIRDAGSTGFLRPVTIIIGVSGCFSLMASASSMPFYIRHIVVRDDQIERLTGAGNSLLGGTSAIARLDLVAQFVKQRAV